MPVDRTIAEELAREMALLYRGLETRLAIDTARAIRQNIRATNETAKLEAIRQLRQRTEAAMRQLEGRNREAALRAIMGAYAIGGRAAVDELTRLGGDRRRDWLARRSGIVAALADLTGMTRRRDTAVAAELAALRTVLPGIDAITTIARELTNRMSSTHLRVVRWPEDVYRQVIARVAPQALAGVQTRLRIAQVAWEDLLSQGITGFVDRSGRRWELASYVEMATRTTVAHAAVESHLDRMSEAGIDLVIVSNAPEQCERCRPWQGQVLARTGPTGSVETMHATEDRMITVEVAGTIDEAIAAGLLHPNCRHSLSSYLPGVTRPVSTAGDPVGGEARQHQRAIERDIRKEKRKEAAPVLPGAAGDHRSEVRRLQGDLREHLKAHPGLARKRHREQIGLAR